MARSRRYNFRLDLDDPDEAAIADWLERRRREGYDYSKTIRQALASELAGRPELGADLATAVERLIRMVEAGGVPREQAQREAGLPAEFAEHMKKIAKPGYRLEE